MSNSQIHNSFMKTKESGIKEGPKKEGRVINMEISIQGNKIKENLERL